MHIPLFNANKVIQFLHSISNYISKLSFFHLFLILKLVWLNRDMYFGFKQFYNKLVHRWVLLKDYQQNISLESRQKQELQVEIHFLESI